MSRSQRLADRFREVMLNGKWIANTNFKDQLSNISWKEAITKIGSLNTIAALSFHVNYYVGGMLNVFKGGPLEIRDKYSFNSPPIESKKDWEELLQLMWNNAEEFATLLELMPDEKMDEYFADPKYGSYHRNINAMIEHAYYHLGQISLIRKMIWEKNKN